MFLVQVILASRRHAQKFRPYCTSVLQQKSVIKQRYSNVLQEIEKVKAKPVPDDHLGGSFTFIPNRYIHLLRNILYFFKNTHNG